MISPLNSIRSSEPSFSSSSAHTLPQEGNTSSKSPKKALLKQVSTPLSAQNFSDAIEALFRLLTLVSKKESKDDLNKTYRFIFELLGHFTSENLKDFERVGVLDAFLSVSKDMKNSQAKLCYMLGERHEKDARENIEKKQKSNSDYTLKELINSFNSSLLYYSKAISILHGDSQLDAVLQKDIFEKTSLIFVEIIKYRLREGFSKAIRESNPENFQEILEEIRLLEKFCSSNKQLESLYNVAINTIFSITNPKVREKFEGVKELIRNLYAQEHTISQKNLVQHYRDSLAEFRQNFSQNIEDVSVFQDVLMEEFKRFFQEVFLKDSFTILGPPPCGYDIRAMGSIGKRELCPYSDLEYFILMEEDTPPAREYFKNFAALLRLQLILLDETPDLEIAFKSLHDKNASGFKVDGGGDPSKDERLINTPLQMAQVIKKGVSHPGDIENTLLKSISLACTDDKLFLSYQTLLKEYLDEAGKSVLGSIPRRKEIGLSLIKERLRVYRQSSPINFQSLQKSVNIKETFLENILHLIRDLSIYFACNEVNTHGIVDALVDKKIFTPSSGLLIKESLSNLYKIRIRLHQDSRCQNELWDPLEEAHNQILGAEKDHLEKIHWLVLRPLYFSLGKALQNEGGFEKAFQRIDLIQEGFDSLLQENERRGFAPFIRLSVECLIQNGAQDSLHLQFYRYISSLSDTENLRETYLHALENVNAVLADTLAGIPALDGFRLSYARKEKDLQKAIETLTTEEDTGVQIQWGNQKKPQFLKQSCIDQILDEKGDIKNSYEGSMHRVSKTSGSASLHFKQFPSHPLMEYAVGNLYARVAGLLTPAVELVGFTIRSNGTVKEYPVIISQTIEGQNLKDATGPGIDTLEKLVNWDQWSSMLLCSILSMPGDGRLPNYILDSQNNIWCIDNDISFVEPVVQDRFFERKINFCSALFCLFQTKPLSQKALENFCSYDTGVLLNSWLLDVIKKDKECQSLFTKEEKKLWLEQASSCKSTILLRQGTVATLNLQFWRLQTYIKSSLQKKGPITPLDLLGQIVSLRKDMTLENPAGAFIASKYKHNAQKKASVDQLLSNILGRSSGQSLTSFQSDMACFEKPPTIKEIEERALFSPEGAREELLVTLISQVFSEDHDAVYTGNRSETEVLQGNFMNVSLERQKIIVISLSQFIKLSSVKPKVVILQHCEALDSSNLSLFLHQDLEYLDVRFCKKIKGRDFELIARLCPHLKELHVTMAPEIINIKRGVFSSKLVFPELEVLKISSCENLESVNVEAPVLKTFDLRNNPKLSGINCSTVPLHKLDFRGSPKLSKLVLESVCNKSKISTLNVSEWSKYSLDGWWKALDLEKKITDPLVDLKIFEFFINNGLDLYNAIDLNIVFEAHAKSPLPFVSFFIAHIRDIESEKTEGDTLIIVAARHGCLESMKVFLEGGADINRKNKFGNTALMTASESGQDLMVGFLLDKGALVNLQNHEGETALMKAARCNNASVLTRLLQKGAEVDLEDFEGNTALTRAIIAKDTQILDILLKKGADVNRQNFKRSTPLMCAAIHGDVTIAEMLLKCGADIDHVNSRGDSALTYAASFGNFGIVSTLLRSIAGTNQIDERREIAVTCAREYNASINFLRKHS